MSYRKKSKKNGDRLNKSLPIPQAAFPGAFLGWPVIDISVSSNITLLGSDCGRGRPSLYRSIK